MLTGIPEAAADVRRALTAATRGLVEREALVEAIALSAVAREHVLVLGPPGTAKSQAVRRVAQSLGGHYFEYLLGRFTEPSEIFGPVDLRKLRDGQVETQTEGMLPEAEFAFLDEVFRGSTAILNTLLALLNERVFRRGHTLRPCPLRVCVGASNELPEDDTLAAFADRFLVRVFVDPIPDPRLEELLQGGWSLGSERLPSPQGSLEGLDRLVAAVDEVGIDAVQPALAHSLRLLRRAGVVLSDRRMVKAQRLVAAATVLAGRSGAGEPDLWPLVLAVPTRTQQATAREALAEVLAQSHNPTLPGITEEASRGIRARAARLAAAAREALGQRPEGGEALEDWRLRLETLARGIDATFAPTELPHDLAEARAEIVTALGGHGR